MRQSRSQIRRLIHSTPKYLLAVLAITLIYIWTRSSTLIKKSKDPYPSISRSLVIASTTSSNLTWLDTSLKASPWKPYIYTTDATHTSPPTLPGALSVPANKGNEAMVYLTWIIDNYAHLPDVVFFHHHHHQAWHQQFTSSFELEHLNVLNVQKHGYLSPRCLPGCENVIKLTGDVAPLEDLRTTGRDVQIASVLHAFWRDGDGGRRELPTEIAAPCCAQFAVSKDRILGVEEGTWRALREWLVETEMDSASAGRVMEYTWHLWFGMEPVFCPSEKTCLCDVYGIGECAAKEL